MNLTTDTLRKIADAVDGLTSAKVNTDRIRVHGCLIELKYNDSQMDGGSYTISNITHDDARPRMATRPIRDNPQA